MRPAGRRSQGFGHSTSPSPRGGASALSDLQRVLTAIRADVVEADLAIPQVHTRFDAEGRISDSELGARITQLLVNLAEYTRGSVLAGAQMDRGFVA